MESKILSTSEFVKGLLENFSYLCKDIRVTVVANVKSLHMSALILMIVDRQF